MPLRDSFLDRFELFAATATVGAHANSLNKGFRQRDVKFLVELFSNWVETSIGDLVLEVQNTQISRYLEELVEAGYAKKRKNGRVPEYTLTRGGLIELISRAVSREFFEGREQFFFLYYFIRNYRERIHEQVRIEGKKFPIALQLELEELTDHNALLQKQIAWVKKELVKLDARIDEQEPIAQDIQAALKRGEDYQSAVQEIEDRYPYALNSQKPFAELLAELPRELSNWELVKGTVIRRDQIWLPTKRLLLAYLEELEGLVEERD